MSQIGSIVYSLNTAITKKLNDENIEKRTMRMSRNLDEELQRIIDRGFDKIIPREVNHLRTFIREYKTRRIPIGPVLYYIDNLWALGISTENMIKVRNVKQYNGNLSIIVQDIYKIIGDTLTPTEIEFAYDDIIKLAEQLVEKQDANFDIETYRDEVSKITDEAKVKASEWIDKELAKNTDKDSFLEQVISEINISVKNKEIANALLEEVEEIRLLNRNEREDRLNKVMDKVKETELDESIRRETVKIMTNILKDAGFVTSKPTLKDGEVVLKAKRPSGNSADIKVQLNGSFTYKLHEYEGSMCKADIENFKETLEEVYGVEILKNTVEWENPDKIMNGYVNKSKYKER